MGKQWKQWETLPFWAPKSLQIVTAALKLRHLLLGRKFMTNPDSILKTRAITLTTKVHLVKAVVFPVVMYGCESWTIRKAEHRFDAFELWCWRRLLRVPWTARRSNQSILKEFSPRCSFWKDWWWRPGVLKFMGSQNQTQLSDWTELNWTLLCIIEQMLNTCRL